ncbi:4-hydroxythreonine-4-phosphate dehydrogenase PdxA [Paenibacillus sp.]|uniref:4-hydroxythreonine-4-phosphate dehydrogenase PdxA n=1 Tax=Paenibacillus sp. TaxID=58172 RepID=UPI002D4BC285|nr:4-hydroxythreonine-4-phosphate dehydrogenase PdxA [Paenibacillus sp.]HZG55021.1 4-hydroxythreonine-4-phosphate dehydrogenase PdxA [Paenibacillus sp.]
MNLPIVGITMGDGAGVGPEIIVKALGHAEVYERCRPLAIGDAKRLEQVARICGADVAVRRIREVEEAAFAPGVLDCIDLDLLPNDLPFGRVSAEAGRAAYAYLETAVGLALDRRIDAICTAPLNKEALHAGGHAFPGHTEILAHLTGTEKVSMMLATPKLKVIHLTTHIGLIQAIESITPERTYEVVKLAHGTLSAGGVAHPRIGVCGINPHAGENGLFGYGEEATKLAPGIERARLEGIDVTGPYPADTLFYRAARGDFDVVVACYHDQGHGPVKVLGIEAGVNITVGLKGGVVRTSVDHGTAFDIAGTGVADERSLLEAIRMAAELSPKPSSAAAATPAVDGPNEGKGRIADDKSADR